MSLEELKVKRDRTAAALNKVKEKSDEYRHKERHITALTGELKFLDKEIGKLEKSL